MSDVQLALFRFPALPETLFDQLCLDCLVDTVELREYYIVRDDVWARCANPTAGCSASDAWRDAWAAGSSRASLRTFRSTTATYDARSDCARGCWGPHDHDDRLDGPRRGPRSPGRPVTRNAPCCQCRQPFSNDDGRCVYCGRALPNRKRGCRRRRSLSRSGSSTASHGGSRRGLTVIRSWPRPGATTASAIVARTRARRSSIVRLGQSPAVTVTAGTVAATRSASRSRASSRARRNSARRSAADGSSATTEKARMAREFGLAHVELGGCGFTSIFDARPSFHVREKGLHRFRHGSLGNLRADRDALRTVGHRRAAVERVELAALLRRADDHAGAAGAAAQHAETGQEAIGHGSAAARQPHPLHTLERGRRDDRGVRRLVHVAAEAELAQDDP